MDFNFIAQNATAILGIIGALAFFVVIIVELTKEIPGIRKMPTKLWTIIVAIIVCMVGTIIYFAMAAAPLYWYYIVLAFFGAFIVAYIAMFGWDSANELWNRFTDKK